MLKSHQLPINCFPSDSITSSHLSDSGVTRQREPCPFKKKKKHEHDGRLCNCCQRKCSKQTNFVEEAGLQRGWTKAPVQLESRLQGSSCQRPLVSQSGQRGQTPHGGRSLNCVSFIFKMGRSRSNLVPPLMSRRWTRDRFWTCRISVLLWVLSGPSWVFEDNVCVCVCFGCGIKNI